MKLKAHPRYDAFRKWMDAHKADAISIDGEFYRVAGPRHTTAKEIVQGVGAYKAGGRWNPPGVMNVVYLSEAPETAVAEGNEHFRYYKLPIWKGMPKVIVGVRVEVSEILDLRNVAGLPESMANLLAEDWRAVMGRGDEPTSQAIGRAAYSAGLPGLIVPSKPDPKGTNMLIFPQNLGKSHSIDVLNPELLEKLGKPS